MKFYKHALPIVLIMILLAVSLSVVSATEDSNSTDLQTINKNNTITLIAESNNYNQINSNHDNNYYTLMSGDLNKFFVREYTIDNERIHN